MSNSNKALHKDTIKFAESKGISGSSFNHAKETMNSNKPDDVVYHRGLQTTLKKEYGYNSPYYKDNCEILHKYDNSDNWK